MIDPYRHRRIELWIVASLSFGTTLLFLWIMMSREALFLIWFTIPFAVATMIAVWKVTRPDSVFRREREQEDAFFNKHPILASVLILAGSTYSLWTFGVMIFRLIKKIFAS